MTARDERALAQKVHYAVLLVTLAALVALARMLVPPSWEPFTALLCGIIVGAILWGRRPEKHRCVGCSRHWAGSSGAEYCGDCHRTTAETTWRYHELVYAVASKYTNETRHHTALRYIQQAESREIHAAQGAVMTDAKVLELALREYLERERLRLQRAAEAVQSHPDATPNQKTGIALAVAAEAQALAGVEAELDRIVRVPS